MNRIALMLVLLGASQTLCAEVATEQDQETVDALRQRIEQLEKAMDDRLNAMADQIEHHPPSSSSRVHIAGYGEMHYNNLDQDGDDFKELDFHRFVLFFGYEFNDRARFVSELEIEHIIASSSSRGAVELEQAYVEIDLKPTMHLQTGAILMPIGIINETHEPPTFYGVERPVVETRVIPTTWWSGGVKFFHNLANGVRYDLMVSEGLKTEDPTSNPSADPFDIKKGKQKASFASAYDLALTARVAYTGIAGLQLAAYAQYQPDLDQSAEQSYAEDATLVGGHVIYQWAQLTGKALYARWDLAGDAAAEAGRDVQDGGYLELAWRPLDALGFFLRQSNWSLQTELDAEQTDFGVNYYPFQDIVFKADYQLQNDDAGNTDGFNLGFGYQF